MSVVEEHLADCFGLNESRYQWAVDEHYYRQRQARGRTPLFSFFFFFLRASGYSSARAQFSHPCLTFEILPSTKSSNRSDFNAWRSRSNNSTRRRCAADGEGGPDLLSSKRLRRLVKLKRQYTMVLMN